jgi:hypothetical protein
MPDDAEACAAPCVDEQVGLVPEVEADAERGGFQKPVHLCEGWFEPLRVVGAIARDVGRVGDDQVHAAELHRVRDFDAVALQDGAEVGGGRVIEVLAMVMGFGRSCFVGRVIAANARPPRPADKERLQALYRRSRRPKSQAALRFSTSGSVDFGSL